MILPKSLWNSLDQGLANYSPWFGHLFLVNKVLWEKATSIHLCIVYSCFCTTRLKIVIICSFRSKANETIRGMKVTQTEY